MTITMHAEKTELFRLPYNETNLDRGSFVKVHRYAANRPQESGTMFIVLGTGRDWCWQNIETGSRYYDQWELFRDYMDEDANVLLETFEILSYNEQ